MNSDHKYQALQPDPREFASDEFQAVFDTTINFDTHDSSGNRSGNSFSYKNQMGYFDDFAQMENELKAQS